MTDEYLFSNIYNGSYANYPILLDRFLRHNSLNMVLDSFTKLSLENVEKLALILRINLDRRQKINLIKERFKDNLLSKIKYQKYKNVDIIKKNPQEIDILIIMTTFDDLIVEFFIEDLPDSMIDGIMKEVLLNIYA